MNQMPRELAFSILDWTCVLGRRPVSFHRWAAEVCPLLSERSAARAWERLKFRLRAYRVPVEFVHVCHTAGCVDRYYVPGGAGSWIENTDRCVSGTTEIAVSFRAEAWADDMLARYARRRFIRDALRAS